MDVIDLAPSNLDRTYTNVNVGHLVMGRGYVCHWEPESRMHRVRCQLRSVLYMSLLHPVSIYLVQLAAQVSISPDKVATTEEFARLHDA